VAQVAGLSCQVAAEFSSLKQQVPNVGQCVDNVYQAANGDGVQQTTGGLFVFRKATASPAFTDGYHTWAIGPQGLQERLNTQSFSWEDSFVASTVLGATHTQVAPTLKVMDTTIGAVAGPLSFRLAGSGFQSGEAVTLQGTYTPLQASSDTQPCQTLPLGPLRLHADSNGNFVATLDTVNPYTGVNYFIRATGAQSGPSNLALSVVTASC